MYLGDREIPIGQKRLDNAKHAIKLVWRLEATGIVGRLANVQLLELIRQDQHLVHVGQDRMNVGRGLRFGQIQHRKVRQMASATDYDELRVRIEATGYFTTLRPDPTGGFNLICVTSRNCTGDLCGNSFWVWLGDNRQWYLATWGDYYYEIPLDSCVYTVCVECLRQDSTPIVTVSDEIVTRFGLRKVSRLSCYPD